MPVRVIGKDIMKAKTKTLFLSIAVGVFTLVITSASLPVQAAALTVQYSGIITSVRGFDSSVQLGTVFNGFYTFDISNIAALSEGGTSGTATDGDQYQFFNSPNAMSATVGDYSFTSNTGADQPLYLFTQKLASGGQPTFEQSKYIARGINNSSSFFSLVQISLAGDANALPSAFSIGKAPELSKFSTAEFNFTTGNSATLAVGTIDSLVVVPEPSSVSGLLGFGVMAGVAFVRRHAGKSSADRFLK